MSGSKFFGRETISLLVILPIALPGIITGIALRSAFSLADIPFSFWTIVLGHATFCIVVVYNNAVARFRRTSGSMIEAAMDLGADKFQTFRHIILPNIATALLAGGMLAFALSFDEVIVTTFTAGQQQTLPLWMLEELIRPRQRPVTNVVAMVVVVVTLLPILFAFYLSRGGEQSVAGWGMRHPNRVIREAGTCTRHEIPLRGMTVTVGGTHEHRNADRLALRGGHGRPRSRSSTRKPAS